MLKVVHNPSFTDHLKAKSPNILITNACNMHCGGCSQHCGVIKDHRPEEIWHITPEQFYFNVKVLTHECRSYKVFPRNIIGIFGGEPTLHPQFDEILNITKEFPDWQFRIFTNHTHPERLLRLENLRVFGGAWEGKVSRAGRFFKATMIAPYDIVGNPSKNYYWDCASTYCVMWQQCCTIIYDNKAYFCEAAAAFDRLSLGKDQWHLSSGWDMVLGKDPFDQSPDDIARQAIKSCYRCGWCKHYRQSAVEPSKITLTNQELLLPRDYTNSVSTSENLNVNPSS